FLLAQVPALDPPLPAHGHAGEQRALVERAAVPGCLPGSDRLLSLGGAGVPLPPTDAGHPLRPSRLLSARHPPCLPGGLPPLPRRPASERVVEGGLMKLRAVDFLVCPTCASECDVAADSWEGSEVLEGCLLCRQCALEYPIRAGVPRFVPDGAYA